MIGFFSQIEILLLYMLNCKKFQVFSRFQGFLATLLFNETLHNLNKHDQKIKLDKI